MALAACFVYALHRLSFVVAGASECCCHPATHQGVSCKHDVCGDNAHKCISLLEDHSFVSPSLMSISADATANSNTKESEADANSNTKESKADESSVSSLSTSKSIWEKGYHLPEAVTISSTMAVAKSAIKSNPVT